MLDFPPNDSDINFKRRKIWKKVFNRSKFIEDWIKELDEENRTSFEYDMLELLSNGASWNFLIIPEWYEIYGAIYDEADNFVLDDTELNKIRKDIHRTFSIFQENLPFANSLYLKINKSLYCTRLEKVLTVSTHQSNYCQGMNFIAAAFILEGKSPREAFIFMSFLLRQRFITILFDPKSSSLFDYMKIFERLLRKKDRLFIKGKYYTITEYPIFEGHYLFSSEWKSEIPVSKKSIDKYFYTEKGLRKLKLKRLKTLKFKS
jgi:hypothetical protein